MLTTQGGRGDRAGRKGFSWGPRAEVTNARVPGRQERCSTVLLVAAWGMRGDKVRLPALQPHALPSACFTEVDRSPVGFGHILGQPSQDTRT